MTLTLLLASVLAAEPSPQQLELLKTFRAEFVLVTPGVGKFPKSYRMGRDGGGTAEQPVHSVALGDSFFVAKYEVPQNLWLAVMGSNPSKWKGPRNSVEMVSFTDAQDFCRRATEFMRSAKLIADGEIIRLPTESEWEYVARAGSSTVYSFGDDRKELGKYGWSTENAAGNDPPIGAKQPNPWGLYDVHGYLWEWCLDSWHADYRGAPADAAAWTADAKEDRGVARGGSWKDPVEKLTSSYRQPFPRDTRDDALGLRCILIKTK